MPFQIDHVFVLMLENRSFNHLLTYSGIPGLTGVDRTKTNKTAKGATIAMSNTGLNVAASDPHHEFEHVDQQIYNVSRTIPNRPKAMEGFVINSGPEVMQCIDPSNLPVLTELGKQFLVCDNWFSSVPGPTWPNRFFIHAGSSGGLSNSPSSLTTIGAVIWSKLGFSFDNGNVFDAVEKAGKTWRVYHGDHFPQVCAIDTMPSIFVLDPNKFRSLNKFAGDLSNGDAASYTFIEPDYGIFTKFKNGNSQHPKGALSAGEQLIRDVYEAISANATVWSKSMLFVVYDEHGGYYDQVPPPPCKPPGDTPRNAGKASDPPNPPFAFDNYGVRVPAVVISPLLKPGNVSHERYDHTSIIRTVYDVLGMQGKLTARDAAAKSLFPLLQPNPQFGAPPKLPNVHIPAAPAPVVSPANAPPSPSIDGFTRIAAQIDHALQMYQAPVAPVALDQMLRATSDIREVLQLPVSADPNESIAYMEKVAARIDAHRIAQGQGPVK